MFYDIYLKLCDKNGVSPTKAAEDMGIGKATVSRWKNNGSLPITRHIRIMTEYFSVSPNYLLSISENETITLGADELMHLISILHNRPDIKELVYLADKSSTEKINKLSEILKIL